MSKKKLPAGQSYLLMLGSAALIAVRFQERDYNEWGSFDYLIVAVCTLTIIFSIISLLEKKNEPRDY
ncbi:hypothetical protein [Prolixibacter sp. NT017]|uniref:hypothetical protein n=1 Tax=Prolixibacter sp. NT017 TaxID=2652390 RepID=UPI00126AABC0|nr:hypothetical protein [Prolixibacter sp. NT017]GET25534.1 hypothetical protein NT017_18630 [Prolixibacter sp. NT017]